jgi:hypothetical protein
MAEQNQNGQKPQGDEKYEIRMKPHCGKMLLGRSYKVMDDKGTVTTTTVRPRRMDDLVEVVDSYLEAREIRPDGSAGEGPTAIVPRALIAGYLDKDGKPTRVIDGYPMIRVKGSDVTEDESGNPIAPVADTWKPGRITRREDKTLVASHADCTFEVVRKVA